MFSIGQTSRPSNKSFRQLIEKLCKVFTKDFTHVMSRDTTICVKEDELIVNLQQ